MWRFSIKPKRKKCDETNKPACTNAASQGPIDPVCPKELDPKAESDLYTCPSGACKDSDRVNKQSAESCDVSDMLCVKAADGSASWKCDCNGNMDPSSAQCSQLYGGASTSCLNNQWTCVCGSNPLVVSEAEECASKYGGSLVCDGSSKNWICVCGGGGAAGSSRQKIDADSCLNTYGKGFEPFCNQSTGQVLCKCGGYTSLDTKNMCDNDLYGNTTVNACVVMNQDAIDAGTETDPVYGWQCVDQEDICGAISSAPSCGISSSGDALNPVCRVYPLPSTYVCTGGDCDTVSATCSSSYREMYGSEILLDYTESNSPLRLLFLLYGCLFADDIASCMSDAAEYYGTNSSGLPNITINPNYKTQDYLPSMCLEQDDQSSSSSGDNSMKCSRMKCPKPISIPNSFDLYDDYVQGSSIMRAGCIYPKLGIGSDEIDQRYSFLSSKIQTRFTDFSQYSFSPATNLNYGLTAFVIVPYDSAKCNTGEVNLQNLTNRQIQWVMLPSCDNYSMVQKSIQMRLYPIQNFHPFLLWRMAPIQPGGGSQDANGFNKGYYLESSVNRFKGPEGNDAKTAENHTFSVKGSHFFFLTHNTSSTYVDMTGCSYGDWSTNNCSCGPDNCAHKNLVPVSFMKNKEQYDNYSSFFNTGNASLITSTDLRKSITPLINDTNGGTIPGYGSAGGYDSNYNNVFTIYQMNHEDGDKKDKENCYNPSQNNRINDYSEYFYNFYLGCPSFLGTLGYPQGTGMANSHMIQALSFTTMAPSKAVNTGPKESSFFQIMQIDNVDNRLNGSKIMQKYANTTSLNAVGQYEEEQLHPLYCDYPPELPFYTDGGKTPRNPYTCFVAPIQYGLTDTSQKSSGINCFVELYVWNRDFSDWFAVGLLYRNINLDGSPSNTGASTTSLVQRYSTSSSSMLWTIKATCVNLVGCSYGSLPEYNWTATFQCNDMLSLYMQPDFDNYISGSNVVQQSDNGVYGIKYSSNTSNNVAKHYVHIDGYVYTISNGKKYYLCVVNPIVGGPNVQIPAYVCIENIPPADNAASGGNNNSSSGNTVKFELAMLSVFFVNTSIANV